MIPAMVIKAVVPKVLDMILRQFKGIEKIQHLVKYMEEANETDNAVKQLADEIDEMKDEIAGLKIELKKAKSE